MNHRPTLALVATLVLSLAHPALAQQDEHRHEAHDGHTERQLELQLPEHGKWAGDESLRQGMVELKAAFEPAHQAYREDSFDAGRAAALADRVEETVHFMFANCQLPADADAELHKLLAAALGAAESLRQSDDLHQGLHRLHRVLQTYSDHFEHPGWED
ncbi:MAG: hypothetical protein GVY32_11940 [Gammaproteobacteria bacterium]|jgi:hypothetical protein|nr:hypothetical protein [Gammaproteobacteria bacterium]